MYLLVDFNALYHRSRHALVKRVKLTAPDGTPTTGVYSTLKGLISFYKKFAPCKVIVCTEGKHSTAERKKQDPNYKGNRSKQEPEFYSEMELTLKVISSLFPVVSVEGREADDTLAYLSNVLEEEKVILTCDKDLLALAKADCKVELFNTSKKMNKLWDSAAVCEYYGLAEPSELYQLKALDGDKSDNIKGYPGIGPKTAAKILGEWRKGSSPTFDKKCKGDLTLYKTNLFLVTPRPVEPSSVCIPSPLPVPNSQRFEAWMKQLNMKLEFNYVG